MTNRSGSVIQWYIFHFVFSHLVFLWLCINILNFERRYVGMWHTVLRISPSKTPTAQMSLALKHVKPIAYPRVNVSLLEAMIYATKSCKLANNLWYNSQLEVLNWTSHVPNNQVSENEFVSWKITAEFRWVSQGNRQLAVLLPQQESSKLPLLCSLGPHREIRQGNHPAPKHRGFFWEDSFRFVIESYYIPSFVDVPFGEWMWDLWFWLDVSLTPWR